MICRTEPTSVGSGHSDNCRIQLLKSCNQVAASFPFGPPKFLCRYPVSLLNRFRCEKKVTNETRKLTKDWGGKEEDERGRRVEGSTLPVVGFSPKYFVQPTVPPGTTYQRLFEDLPRR